MQNVETHNDHECFDVGYTAFVVPVPKCLSLSTNIVAVISLRIRAWNRKKVRLYFGQSVTRKIKA